MNPRVEHRPDPDQLLRRFEADERVGRLKIFLGYASGTGKTFRMLDEGRRRKMRGEDVVVGAMQPEVPDEARALMAQLETIPLRSGVAVDVDAVVRRGPEVCLIDGLAYDNPPGSRNAHRWQDVRELLAARVSVITSLNLIHIAEYRDTVETITGKRVRETVPVAFVHQADEIAVVDAPAEYAVERARTAQSGADSQELARKLGELRELALLVAADVVDRQLIATLAAEGVPPGWGAQERILVCLTPRANAEKMMASARRNADRFHGQLYAVYVTQPEISPLDRVALDRNLDIARTAGAKVTVLEGVDPVQAILTFAARNAITQIFIGHSRRAGMLSRFARTPVDRLLESADNIDVRVFPQ